MFLMFEFRCLLSLSSLYTHTRTRAHLWTIGADFFLFNSCCYLVFGWYIYIDMCVCVHITSINDWFTNRGNKNDDCSRIHTLNKSFLSRFSTSYCCFIVIVILMFFSQFFLMGLLCFYFTRKLVVTRWSSSFPCIHYILSKRRTLIISLSLSQWFLSDTHKHKKRACIVLFIHILFRCYISEMIRLVNRNKRLNAWHIWQKLRMQIRDTGCCYCEFQLAIIIIIVKTNASSSSIENNSELKREEKDRKKKKKNGWRRDNKRQYRKKLEKEKEERCWPICV